MLVVYRRVKQTVVERNRHEVQAVLAEMQTVNALYVAHIKIYRGKSSSVRMAETRPQKIFTRSSVFCLLDVCELSLSSVVVKNSLLNCFLTEEAV